MTPPELSLISTIAEKKTAPAASSRLTVLKKRPSFQRASKGKRVSKPGFILQMVTRPEGEAETARIGFTCSKKVGNAVARNRAKRRLREIARLVLIPLAKPSNDYVLIGRRDATASLDFVRLQDDLRAAIAILHGAKR